MIVKGGSRSGPASLAAHLGNVEKNEKVRMIEVKGTVASDLRGALIEMDAYAAGTRATKSLYHAALSPEPPHRLTPEQRLEAITALEDKLGLTGHARVIVLHEKEGREHLHCVWSRIDIAQMRAVSDSHNYRKHEEVARYLEKQFGHDRVQGAHHEREGVERPDRTPSRAELRQEERTGITTKTVKAEVSGLFENSRDANEFKGALEERGYMLARGDRRDFVVIDREGGIHSLARRVGDIKAAELRNFMSEIDPAQIPDVATAQRLIESRKQARDEAEYQTGEAAPNDDYAKGADYVTQSRAALQDHQQRQAKLNDKKTPTATDDFANWKPSTGWKLNDDRGPQQEAPGDGHSRSR